MDPFALCLALGPVAIYVMLLGMINLARRPFLVSGSRDLTALGLAVAGLFIIGPIQLFFPQAASVLFREYVWIILAILYALGVSLVILSVRPRLVIYNISADELRPILADVVQRLDPEARWAGDSLTLPTLNVRLHFEASSFFRNLSLVSSGPHQDPLGWRKLETTLAEALRGFAVPRNVRCISLIVIGVLLAGYLGWVAAIDPQQTAQSMLELFRS
ncbi:MAG: hypothetical protein JW818_01790 [Pirellulales bacterium]|nr:hypothetical protein [Pirellulales bacterium]